MKNKSFLISALLGLVAAYITYILYNATNYAISRAGYSGLTNIILSFTSTLGLVVAILLTRWMGSDKDANKKDIYVLLAVFTIVAIIMYTAQLKL